MVKIISWNIARRHAAWRCLPESDADIVLLQEAGLPPDDVSARIEVDPVPFLDENGRRISRSAIAKLSHRMQVEWLTPAPLGQQTDPWPEWLPQDSRTLHRMFRHIVTLLVSEHQLDFVFASESMVDSVRVSALNNPDDWGPSDHCRIEIVVEA